MICDPEVALRACADAVAESEHLAVARTRVFAIVKATLGVDEPRSDHSLRWEAEHA